MCFTCWMYGTTWSQAVYHMPTSEEDEPEKSLPLALQSLFYKVCS